MIDAVNECRKAVGLAAPMASPALVAAPVAAAPAPQPAPLPPKPTDDLKVQAILYAPGHSAAVLDGKTCEEGDTVHGRRVVKIARDTVTVEFQGQTKILSMN
jgi:hypothetical protein